MRKLAANPNSTLRIFRHPRFMRRHTMGGNFRLVPLFVLRVANPAPVTENPNIRNSKILERGTPGHAGFRISSCLRLNVTQSSQATSVSLVAYSLRGT